MTRWALAIDAIGSVLIRGGVLQAALLVATMPLWVWITVAPSADHATPWPRLTAAFSSPTAALITCVLLAAFVIPAIIAACHVVSAPQETPAARPWTGFWTFFRGNYVSACRSGMLVGVALLGLSLVIATRPALWPAVLVPLLVLGLVTSHLIGFNAHLRLRVADEFLRSAYLLVRTPRVTLLMIVTYVGMVTIFALLPGVAVAAGLVLVAHVNNALFQHAVNATKHHER